MDGHVWVLLRARERLEDDDGGADRRGSERQKARCEGLSETVEASRALMRKGWLKGCSSRLLREAAGSDGGSEGDL